MTTLTTEELNRISDIGRKNLALKKKLISKNKKEILAYFKSLGLTKVVVEYNGVADSGQIDSISYFIDEKEIELKDNPRISWYETQLKEFDVLERKIKKPFKEAIESITFEIIFSNHPDWHIDEGSNGELNFNVNEDRIDLTHNAWFTDSHTTEHTI